MHLILSMQLVTRTCGRRSCAPAPVLGIDRPEVSRNRRESYVKKLSNLSGAGDEPLPVPGLHTFARTGLSTDGGRDGCGAAGRSGRGDQHDDQDYPSAVRVLSAVVGHEVYGASGRTGQRDTHDDRDHPSADRATAVTTTVCRKSC